MTAPWPPYPPPPPLSPAGVPLAEFTQRLLAYMIDMALLSAVGFVLFAPAFLVMFSRMQFPDPYDSQPDFDEVLTDWFVPLLLLEVGFFALMMVLYFVYAVEYMHRSGQTLGKKAMKIRIVPLDPALRLTRGMAAKRYLVEYVGGMFVPFFSWVDGLWQLQDKPYQQTLHDKFARTVVVKVSP
ncbi:RDD family protein [Paractinoplanes abujensis]|uniref:Putative RDD family membrane protein YckC n=1 Tax=Paractinoplanes abujensis TaxID=882441 RepID=A0A7W7CXJ4_9ACTN|nr:RDD family protein [Actinoplanes abujensis]MBB4696467.1 putative RDD family membrane protein YckC [Actinoplanes abujensis]GID22463.1 RDD family protein [Actinoplanes abujensis]